MEFSSKGLDLLKRSEGFRSKVYPDTAGFLTIGYGHKLDGPLPKPWVDGISEEAAANLLHADIGRAQAATNHLVKVALTQGQYDALVDFTFNLGVSSLASSTLLKDLNAGQYNEAAEQLLRWDHANHKQVAGLTARRKAEFNLWHGKE
jgi:lysozyme